MAAQHTYPWLASFHVLYKTILHKVYRYKNREPKASLFVKKPCRRHLCAKMCSAASCIGALWSVLGNFVLKSGKDVLFLV